MHTHTHQPWWRGLSESARGWRESCECVPSPPRAGLAISISLLGEPLRGSPFTCVVSTPTPSAPHCVLRGGALQTAVARREETL